MLLYVKTQPIIVVLSTLGIMISNKPEFTLPEDSSTPVLGWLANGV